MDEIDLVDKAYLKLFRSKLDGCIPKLDWACTDTMLLHYLQFLDYFCLHITPQLVAKYGVDTEAALKSTTTNAAGYVIRWIGESSKSESFQQSSIVYISEKIVQQFLKIQDVAASYNEIVDQLSAAFEAFYTVHTVSETFLGVSYGSEMLARGEASEWLAKHLQRVNHALAFDPTNLIKDVTSNPLPDKYFVPHHHIIGLMKTNNPYFESLWRMDPESDFVAFKMSHVKEIWRAVYALAEIQLNLAKLDANGFPFNKVLLRLPKEQWVKKIAYLTTYDKAFVETIFNLLIYKPDGLSDIAIEPFVELSDGSIVMSNSMVRESNVESNFCCRWIRTNEKQYGSIASNKEEWWVKQKKPELEALGFIVRESINYPPGPKSDGDIDLFLYHVASKTGLCCQFKWFLIPDRFKQGNIKKVVEGVEQAKRAIEWIKTSPGNAQSALRIKKSLFENCTVLPLVISRDWMLNGLHWDPEVPILSEPLFDCLLSKADSANPLKSLWSCAFYRMYLPEIGKDFRISKRTLVLNNGDGVQLEYEKLESVRKSSWSCERIKYPPTMDEFKRTLVLQYERIAERAYGLWQNRGQIHGRDQHDWIMAEQNLIASAWDEKWL